MRFYADFHLHSKYSRACSPKMDVPHLVKYGKMKGLNLYGTGDFTHPKWFSHLKKTLEGGSNGFYEREGVNFVVSGEISLIYSQDGSVRKNHVLVILPSLSAAEQVNEALSKVGNLEADGRPILGMSSPDFVETVISLVPDAMIIPAHVWTPWFSMFGSKSGFDSMKDCFQEQCKHVFAVETGLSSDPSMNWRVKQLDDKTLLSNSDAHSPWPHRVGREANVLELRELSYHELYKVIKEGDASKFLFTIETNPAYGKYHWDGHRACSVSVPPKKAMRMNNVCPKCGSEFTIGVDHRVEELADREKGYEPEGKPGFKNLLPLTEILSKVLGVGVSTKMVWRAYKKAIQELGHEYGILLEKSEEELVKGLGNEVGGAVLAVRKDEVGVKPGYDGVYGKAVFPSVKGEEQEGLSKWA